MGKGILYDSTMCIGCRLCEKACAEHHNLPYNEAVASEEKLSAYKLTAVTTHDDKFMRRLCMNCRADLRFGLPGRGTAEESQRSGDLRRKPVHGVPLLYVGMPLPGPAYEWNSRLPIMKKCDMCADRLAAGLPTECAAACPTGATKFGDRDELIVEARQRIASNPQQYYPHIYGLEEVGGTSMLLLASVPFEQLGVRAGLPHTPLPMLTWRALSEIPNIVTVCGVLLGGVWWLSHRREEVQAAERSEREKKP